jgi:hypothetical protein
MFLTASAMAERPASEIQQELRQLLNSACTGRAWTTFEETDCSPEGNLVAAIVPTEGVSANSSDTDKATLYLIDRASGKIEPLFAQRGSNDPRRSYQRPLHAVFSVDGTSLFVEVAAWTTSDAIHRIDLADKTDHFVIDGNSCDLITGGRWRGNLMVWRHRHRHGGSFDVAQVISTHGRILATIPRSDASDGEAVAARWLRRQNGSPPR